MRPWMLLVPCLVLGLLELAVPAAQLPGEVVSVSGKKLPATPPAPPLGLDPRALTLPVRGLIIYNRPDVVADPRQPKSLVKGLADTLFRTSFPVHEIYTEPVKDPVLGRPRKWYLLDGGGNWLGWLPEEQVVAYATTDGYPEALKATIVVPAKKAGEKDTEKEIPLHRKCMLINKLEKAEKIEDLRARIAFRDRADASAKETVTQSLFGICYVYRETPTHYFVGNDYKARTASSLLGWVPRERACPWNTRECVEFSNDETRKRPTILFETEGEMKRYITADIKPTEKQLASGKNDFKPLALVPAKMPALEYNQARYPLVTEDKLLQGQMPLGGYPMYKVGFIGDVFLPDGSRIAKPEVERLQREVEVVREEASRIQVMFVIDATFGMERYFGKSDKAGEKPRALQLAVEEIMNRATRLTSKDIDGRDLNINVEFSVNFYRDLRDVAKTGVPAFVGSPFGEPVHARAQLNAMSTLVGGDPLDSVYYGLVQALTKHAPKGQQTQFRPNATKIVVLIGDDGDSGADEGYTQERVVDLIKNEPGAVIDFFAVSVGDPKLPRFAALTRQTKEIASKLRDHHEAKLRKDLGGKLSEEVKSSLNFLSDRVIADAQRPLDPEAVAGKIARRFELATAKLVFTQAELKKAMTGTTVREERPNLPEWIPEGTAIIWKKEIEEQLRQKGVARLLDAKQGVQLFHTAWVVERDPAEPLRGTGALAKAPPTIKHMVLVRKDELRNLHTLLFNLLLDFDTRSLQTAWKATLKIVTKADHEVDGSDKGAELIKTHLGISVRERGLLHSSIGELTPNAKQLKELKQELTEAMYRIQDVLEEQESTITTVKDPQGNLEVQRKDPRPKKYWWGGDPTRPQVPWHAWIDRDVLP